MGQQQRESGREELNQGLCKLPLYRRQPRVGRDKSYDAQYRKSLGQVLLNSFLLNIATLVDAIPMIQAGLLLDPRLPIPISTTYPSLPVLLIS